MKNYFKQKLGEGWRSFRSSNSGIGRRYMESCDYVGSKLLTVSRKLLRIGGKRCSWCGEHQTRETGMHMTASKKGLRCGNNKLSCSDKPFI